ncbi:hypothetical protein J6590_003882 [Homalodisca vitripennis]|nr:hypothetical protein J6590_003882 [Homalodisca vitripennis]
MSNGVNIDANTPTWFSPSHTSGDSTADTSHLLSGRPWSRLGRGVGAVITPQKSLELGKNKWYKGRANRDHARTLLRDTALDRTFWRNFSHTLSGMRPADAVPTDQTTT